MLPESSSRNMMLAGGGRTRVNIGVFERSVTAKAPGGADRITNAAHTTASHPLAIARVGPGSMPCLNCGIMDSPLQ